MSTTPLVMLVSSAPLGNRFPSSWDTTTCKLLKYSYPCSNTPLVLRKGRETERISIVSLKKKMSATRAMLDDSNSNTTSTSIERPLANFHSSVWGDYFLSYTPHLTEINSLEKVEHEKLKEDVRRMLAEIPDNSTQKLVLIDTIQRLGVAYHFENEIQTSIQNIFDMSQQDNQNYELDNLYITALCFRLMRQHRHNMSSDVFKKFTNLDGKFRENLSKDLQGLLSLYEAAHLRVHGEDILEEALTFTIIRLESMLPSLSNSLKEQVSEALSHPIHTNLPRLAARNYICLYKKIESHNDLLLKFSKLDFDIVQKAHQRELSKLSSWWKGLDFPNKFSYARDRLVECYFWAVGVLFEPQYSSARSMLTKLVLVIGLIDDSFDAYATFDEIVPFSVAIERCDVSAMDLVPPNLKPAYQVIIDFYNEMEEELTNKDKTDHVYYAKFEMKRWIRAYLKEAEWLNADYIPKCEEYMRNAIVSIGVKLIATTWLVCMEESNITKETLEWIINEPLILQSSSIIGRLKDDIVGHHREQERRHGASFIECYMNEYETSKEEAYVEAGKKITNAWKDINMEFLTCPSRVPTVALELVLNLTRLSDIFQENDFIDTQGEFKEWIASLFVEPVNI